MPPRKPVVVPQPNSPTEKLTVTVFQFEGSGESMRRGFEAIGQALAGAFGTTATATPRQLNGNKRTPAAQLNPAAEPVIDGDDHLPEPDEEQTGDDSPPEAVTTAPAAAKVKREPKKGTFLTKFNLSSADQPSLTQFCTDRKPTTENDKYLVVSEWLMKHGGADPFTPDHIYTCFQAMGSTPLKWKTQVDHMQPIRLMKSKNNLYENPSRGAWRLTQPGLDAATAVGK